MVAQTRVCRPTHPEPSGRSPAEGKLDIRCGLVGERRRYRKLAIHPDEKSPNRISHSRSICYRGLVLPELNDEGRAASRRARGELARVSCPVRRLIIERVWLSGRLRALLELAASNGKLRRAFIWGSFVTAKPAPRDLDILLIMDEDFEVDGAGAAAQAVFDSVRAKLLFESDVFWARASIGRELLDLWLDTYQTSRSFRKRGIVELVLP